MIAQNITVKQLLINGGLYRTNAPIARADYVLYWAERHASSNTRKAYACVFFVIVVIHDESNFPFVFDTEYEIPYREPTQMVWGDCYAIQTWQHKTTDLLYEPLRFEPTCLDTDYEDIM